MYKKISFILFLTINIGFAQQESLYTQYMYNTSIVNPAYTGSSGNAEIFALHRNQWLGIEGAPKTYNLAFSSPISNTNLALGINFLNDKIGPTNTNDITVAASCHLPISEKYKLAFGLQTSVKLFNFDQTKLNIYDLSDIRLQNFTNSTKPNIGIGTYLYRNNFYFGLSIPYILETNLYDDNTINVFQNKMNWYAITGYVFDINENIKAKPTILFKNVNGAPFQLDFACNTMFYEKFTLGLAYRLDASFNAMAGFQVSKSMFLGSAYDLQSTKLENYNSGTHEIFLKYTFIPKTKRVYNPRFF